MSARTAASVPMLGTAANSVCSPWRPERQPSLASVEAKPSRSLGLQNHSHPSCRVRGTPNMENTTNYNFRLRPLPGVRQGTIGAGAGSDSERSTGGRMLSRRASPIQEETADSSSVDVSSPNRVSTTPIRSRRRLKWTVIHNTFIMRTFYQITRLETNMVGYRQKLFEGFHREFPEMVVTEQRVADQRRVILRNNLLPTATLDRIRQEVRQLIENNNETEIQQRGPSQPESSHVSLGRDSFPPGRSPTITQDSPDRSELQDLVLIEWERAKAEFWGLDPLTRPAIPTVRWSSKFLKIVATINDKCIKPCLEQEPTFSEVHAAVYCGAVATVRHMGQEVVARPENADRPSSSGQYTPPWQRRLERKINDLRRDIGRCQQFLHGNRSQRLCRYLTQICRTTRVHTIRELNKNVEEVADTLKQKLGVISKRLRRYKKAVARKKDNQRFSRGEKNFYRKLDVSEFTVETAPTGEALETYWTHIWAHSTDYTDQAPWIISEEQRVATLEPMKPVKLTADAVKTAINKSANWKAPGPDGIHNIWWKKFSEVHSHLARCYREFLQEPNAIPPFLLQGITYMKFKEGDPADPAQYRPLTCLNTAYKIMTSCITTAIQQHTQKPGLMSPMQMGVGTETRGCKELLIIDSVISQQACKKHRNLYITYIDYKKAFDSVPHPWLLRCLEMYKVDKVVIDFLASAMKRWCTTLLLHGPQGPVKSSLLPVRRGIFQGDSLSPLWFCMSLNPLSWMLDEARYGYAVTGEHGNAFKVSHVFYMDDLKTYASTRQHRDRQIEIIRDFSTDIRMEFGWGKCRTQTIIRGKETPVSYKADGKAVEALNPGETYQYLGLQQARCINHTQVKQELKIEFSRRLKSVLRSGLNSRNMTRAVNTFCIPVLTYSFGIIRWSSTDLDSIQRDLRVLLSKYRYRHPKASIEREVLPRVEGGRGYMDIQNLHISMLTSLRNFFIVKAQTSELHAIIAQADIGLTPLVLARQMPEPEHTDLMANWKAKALHGQFPAELSDPNISKKDSTRWLQHGNLFPETEGFIISIQDQVIATRHYKRYIMKNTSILDTTCRMCGSAQETIHHVIGGCTQIAPTEYKARHDAVGKIVHQGLGKRLGLISSTVPHFVYKPQAIMEDGRSQLYWDRTLLTDLNVAHNRPDMVYRDKVKNIAFFIDFAVPNTPNLARTIREKKEKYHALALEIKEQWQLENVTIVPIVISSTGIVPNLLPEALQTLELPQSTCSEIQKAVILGTCRIVRLFLSGGLNINS